MDALCHVEYWQWEDQWYLILVYQDEKRAICTAETRLGPDDWIMVDGSSAAEAASML